MNLELTSERLLLRPLAEADADLGFDLLTDPEVMKYVGETQTRDQVIREMPTVVKRCAGGCIGIWCVIERASGEKLGTAILLPLPIELEDTDWDLVEGPELPEGEIEIGYLLKRSAWGKGFATEAARRLLRFAFEETPLEEVVATTDPENTVSRKVLEKTGLINEGLRRAYATQCQGFRVTRGQWLERDRTTPR